MKIIANKSLLKILCAALSVIMLLVSLLLGFTTWRRVNSLESELIDRHVIPVNYTEKKSAITGKPVKQTSAKKRQISRHVKQGKALVKNHDIGTNLTYSSKSVKNIKKRKHRSLDDVVSDISDRMIVVDE